MKQYFNFRLFKEGFKQSKTVGLIFVVLLSFIYTIIPISEYINLQENKKYLLDTSDLIIRYYAEDLSPVLFVALFIAPFILTFMLFSYLNKRNSSDFYHSIPHKRLTVYISYTLSICAWMAIILIVPSLLLITILEGFYTVFAFNSCTMLICVINILIGSLLIIAGTSLACFITGTSGNNFIVALIILFLPRMIISFFMDLLTDALPIIFDFNNVFILRDDINIINGLIYRGDIDFMSVIGAPTLYTLLLAAILFVLAGFAYIRRDSESAGNATATRKIERILVIVIGFIVSIPSLLIIFSYITSFDDYRRDTASFYFTIIINIIGMAIAIFLYQIISTKKVKHALKSMLFTPVVIVMDFIILSVMTMMFYSALSFSPTADEVDYVKINDFNSYTYYSQYFIDQLTDIEITDKDIIRTVCYTLEDNIAEIKKGYELYMYDHSISLTICVDGTEYNRIIYTDKDAIYENLFGSLFNEDAALDVITTLPNEYDSNVSIKIYDIHNITDAQTLEIYKALKKEIIANPSPFIDYLTDCSAYSTIDVNIETANKDYYLSLPLIPEYPISFQMYLNCNYKDYGDEFENVKERILKLNEDILIYDYVNIYLVEAKNNISNALYSAKIFCNDDLREYLKDPSSFTADEIIRLRRNTGYLTDEELEFLSNIASYISSTPTIQEGYTICTLCLEYYDKFYTTEYYAGIPIILPDSLLNK